MSRGTIIYVGGFELPDLNAAAQRVLANAMIFRDLGYRVGLVGVTRRDGAPALDRVPGFSIEGIEAWETPYPLGQVQWLRRTVDFGEVRAAIEGMGIRPGGLKAIITYNHPAVAQWRLARYARSLGGHAIADVTEWYSDVRNNSLSAVVKNLDGRLRMGWVNGRMDGLITTSPFLSDHYAPTGLPIVELPTLMDEAPGPAGAATPDGQPKRLFFAGSGFDPAVVARTRGGLKDRIDLVVERLAGAARRGADFRLDAYGLTEADYRALRPDHGGLLAELGARVRFHGRRPSKEVRMALRQADYAIFLRDDTRVTLAGFPTKYSEAIAFGAPMLTNPMPNILRYHQEGKTGWLVDRDDPTRGEAQLAHALQRSAGEIQAMKDFCAGSGLFHYRSFLDSVADFMERIA